MAASRLSERRRPFRKVGFFRHHPNHLLSDRRPVISYLFLSSPPRRLGGVSGSTNEPKMG